MTALTTGQSLEMAPSHRRARVLVVGSSADARERISRVLEPRGYEVERVVRLPAALAREAFDIVVFALPRSQDEQVVAQCSESRALGGSAVLVIHEGHDTDFAVRVLEAGADDCMLSPHSPREVMARVRALLRGRARSKARRGGRHCVFDGHQLDTINLIVRSPDGREVRITPMQSRLLTALLARPREVVSREQLLEKVLGEESCTFDRAIDVHVSRLKRRLARITDQDLIMACRGAGYRLDVQDVTP